MSEPIVFIALAVFVLIQFIVIVVMFVKVRRIQRRYGPLIDAEAELARLTEAVQGHAREHERLVSATKAQCEALEKEAKTLRDRLDHEAATRRGQLISDYNQARVVYDHLSRELKSLEENLEDMSFGLYKPHFSFDAPDDYKAKLEELRDTERQMIRSDRAAKCEVSWTVGGSAKDGERMAKQYVKLVLRAFNGESDAALANVSWNNIVKLEERLTKAFDAVNKLGGVMQVAVTKEYLALKIDELRLTHELEAKKNEVKEEQRRIREQMREEEKAQREFERAKEEAEREEFRYEKALEKATAEANKATGTRLAELNDKIAALQGQLFEAHSQKERAISQAQLTKAGHVYVISNVGSFGEDVFKIGMTRRWDPMERVQELGDASVPFPFDVHAIIYSQNAPELEYAMHRHFGSRRVNLVNFRKEFFNVTLEEIEGVARSKGAEVQFTKLAEAREFRETLATRTAEIEKAGQRQDPMLAVEFPTDILSVMAAGTADA